MLGGLGVSAAAIPNTLETFVFQQHHLETVREKQVPGLPSQNKINKSTVKTTKPGLFIPLLESSSPCNSGEQKGNYTREQTPSSAVRVACGSQQPSLLTVGIPKWHHKEQRKAKSFTSWAAPCFRSSAGERASRALFACSTTNTGKTCTASSTTATVSPNGRCAH